MSPRPPSSLRRAVPALLLSAVAAGCERGTLAPCVPSADVTVDGTVASLRATQRDVPRLDDGCRDTAPVRLTLVSRSAVPVGRAGRVRISRDVARPRRRRLVPRWRRDAPRVRCDDRRRHGGRRGGGSRKLGREDRRFDGEAARAQTPRRRTGPCASVALRMNRSLPHFARPKPAPRSATSAGRSRSPRPRSTAAPRREGAGGGVREALRGVLGAARPTARRAAACGERLGVNALAGWRPDARWELSARVRGGSGLPTTPFITGGDAEGTLDFTRYNAGPRLASYFALDARVDRRWPLGGGRRGQLVGYVDVQDLTARRNETYPIYDQRERRVARQLFAGFLPSLGVTWER